MSGENRPEIKAALEALQEVHEGYVKAESYYDGSATTPHSSDSVQLLLKRNQISSVNWASIAVDSVLNRMEINTIASTDDESQKVIEQVWKSNKLGLHARNIHQTALVHGETFVMAHVDPETGEVYIQHQNPKSVKVFYDTENPDLITHGIKTWETPDGLIRANMIYPTVTQRWISTTKATPTQVPLAWEHYTDESEEDDAWEIPNPFGVVPIFRFSTGYPKGVPEHFSCYGAQDSLNQLISIYSTAMEFQAFPQTYALTDTGVKSVIGQANGAPEGDFEEGPGLEEPVAKPQKLKSSPNNLWWLDNIKKIGQLEPIDPKGFIDGMKFFIESMAQVSHTPIHLYQIGGQMPSGESRRVAEMPLIKKVETRQLLFGEAWEQLFSFVLLGLGYADSEITVVWDSPQSTDDLDTWEIVAAKVSAGVPKKVALMEAGYTERQVEKWGYTEETPEAVTSPPVASQAPSTLPAPEAPVVTE